MKYISPIRLKVLMIMFFGTGVLGIVVGLYLAPPQTSLMITFLGVINLSMGGFIGWIFFTQEQPLQEKGKKKRKDH